MRNRLNQQQSNKLVSEKDLILQRKEEISKMDQRIHDLQQRLQKRRLATQSLTNQTSQSENTNSIKTSPEKNGGFDKMDTKYRTLPYNMKISDQDRKNKKIDDVDGSIQTVKDGSTGYIAKNGVNKIRHHIRPRSQSSQLISDQDNHCNSTTSMPASDNTFLSKSYPSKVKAINEHDVTPVNIAEEPRTGGSGQSSPANSDGSNHSGKIEQRIRQDFETKGQYVQPSIQSIGRQSIYSSNEESRPPYRPFVPHTNRTNLSTSDPSSTVNSSPPANFPPLDVNIHYPSQQSLTALPGPLNANNHNSRPRFNISQPHVGRNYVDSANAHVPSATQSQVHHNGFPSVKSQYVSRFSRPNYVSKSYHSDQNQQPTTVSSSSALSESSNYVHRQRMSSFAPRTQETLPVSTAVPTVDSQTSPVYSAHEQNHFQLNSQIQHEYKQRVLTPQSVSVASTVNLSPSIRQFGSSELEHRQQRNDIHSSSGGSKTSAPTVIETLASEVSYKQQFKNEEKNTLHPRQSPNHSNFANQNQLSRPTPASPLSTFSSQSSPAKPIPKEPNAVTTLNTYKTPIPTPRPISSSAAKVSPQIALYNTTTSSLSTNNSQSSDTVSSLSVDQLRLSDDQSRPRYSSTSSTSPGKTVPQFASKSVIANTYTQKLGSKAYDQYRKNMQLLYKDFNSTNSSNISAVEPSHTSEPKPLIAQDEVKEELKPNNVPSELNNNIPTTNVKTISSFFNKISSGSETDVCDGEFPQALITYASDKASYKSTVTPKILRRRHSDADITSEELPQVLDKKPSMETMMEDIDSDKTSADSQSTTTEHEVVVEEKPLADLSKAMELKLKTDVLVKPYKEEETSFGPSYSTTVIKRRKPKDKELVKRKKRVSFEPYYLLLDASLEGELPLVKTTTKEVDNISRANYEGITALHNAICCGHYEVVEYLVSIGADVNSPDSDAWTPLHCAASCNNLAMVKLLIESGACIFATTNSDHETAAEKCEEHEGESDACSQYLYNVQEKLGITNGGEVFAVFDYTAVRDDELSFANGDKMTVSKKGDDVEMEWWWAKFEKLEGYIPRNLLGFYPRVVVDTNKQITVSTNE